MKIYRGFKYENTGTVTEKGSVFKVTFPGGHKFSRAFANEDAVKKTIDDLILQFEGK